MASRTTTPSAHARTTPASRTRTGRTAPAKKAPVKRASTATGAKKATPANKAASSPKSTSAHKPTASTTRSNKRTASTRATTTAARKPAAKKAASGVKSPAKKANRSRKTAAAATKRTPAKRPSSKTTSAKTTSRSRTTAAKNSTANKTAGAAAKKTPARKTAPSRKVTTTTRKTTPRTPPAAAKTSGKKTAPRTKPAPSRKVATTTNKTTPRKRASRTAAATAAPRTFQPRTLDIASRARRNPIWTLNVGRDERAHVRAAGATYDRRNRRWTYTGRDIPDALHRYMPPRYSWERFQQNLANGIRDLHIRPTITLRAHQQQAVDIITTSSSRPGFVLADDVGLGKTYTTVTAANSRGRGLNILVLCPLSVVAHWRLSIDLAGNGHNQWCIVNYDKAKHLLAEPASAVKAKRARTRNKHHAKSGTSLINWDIVICDESHRLKNPHSQRSNAVRNIIGRGSRRAHTLYLSATAGQNPLELAYLINLLAWATRSPVRDLADFETWCQTQGIQVRKGPYGTWTWERNDDDLHTMRQLLFHGRRPIGLRRTPIDIAGWPELNRMLFELELDAHETRLYEQAWDDFCAEMSLIETGQGEPNDNPLAASIRFRQKASLIRVPHTVDAVCDKVDDGYQVAISVQFLDTAEALQTQLTERGRSSVIIAGNVNSSEREQRRISFQQGDVPIVIFTVTEGISLHAGEQAVNATTTERVLLIHDIRWSALDMAQIEGRCHRDGQNAIAYYLYAVDTVEAKVATGALTKLRDMATMLGDNTFGLDPLIEEAARHQPEPRAA